MRKSERAKSHALTLFPKLLEEERIECPSWAQPFTLGKPHPFLQPAKKKHVITLVKRMKPIT